MPAKHWSTDTYAVRERFGLGVLLLATVYVAGIIASFQALGAPPMLSVFVLTLLLWVGICQVLFRRLNAPRAVSLVAGSAYCFLWLFATLAASDRTNASGVGMAGAFALMGGAWLGYTAGAIDASLFLVHDLLSLTFRAKRVAREALRAAAGEEPSESPFDD